MKTWFEANRSDKKFAADVLNFHHYCTDGSKGISPEADNLKTQMKAITDYRTANLPDKEVWLTEFGWDTNPNSTYRAPSQEVQGEWLVRGYMACLAAGVDRITMYMLRDVDPNSSTQFSSCGLVGPKGDWTPKISWYYVYTMKNRLTGLRYFNEQSSGNSNVLIYKFKNTTGNNGAYVVWCPTSNNTTVNNYQLSLTGTPTTAKQVTLTSGYTNGVESVLSISGGKVTVNVSERPIFIMVDNIQ
jgi:hypothetical protein